MSGKNILWLDEITAHQREAVGGKAANLVALLRSGFRVPPGFCVTTFAYRTFVESNDLRGKIEALVRDADRRPDPYTLFARPIDEALERELYAACRRLLVGLPTGDLLAVRSSATTEDLPSASFAGQGETYLNVTPQELPHRIRDCWASLWTARALAYRQRGDETSSGTLPLPEMAVVVQPMVPCDAGGVVFTADPLGGDAVVIEAARGLAEAVVQGTGEITRYTVDRHTLAYRQEGREDNDVLTSRQVQLVVETALTLETHFGRAMDVEWGLWNGELYLFQCRPVTTTQAERFFTQLIPGDDYLWTGGYLDERFPQPVSPLGWSVVGGLTEDLAFRDPLRYLGYPHPDQLPLTKLYRGHPYTNVTVFQILYKVFPAPLVPDDATRYFPAGDVGLRHQAPYPCCVLDPRFVVSMLSHFVREPANWSPLHNYRYWARFAVRHETAMRELDRRSKNAADLSALWDVIETAQRWNRELLGIHRWSLMAADLLVPLLSKLIALWVSKEQQAELSARLLSGLPNKSLEMDRDLRQMAGESDMGAEAMRDFLDRYGHRSFSLDIYHPTFADDPEQVLGLVEMAGREPDPATRVAERESVEREIKAALIARPLGWLKLLIFERVLTLAQRYVILREEQRFAWQLTLALMRRTFLCIGERLATRGVLDRADDVFFATCDEIEALAWDSSPDVSSDAPSTRPLRQTAAARRTTFDRLQREFELAPHLTYPPFLRGNRPLEDTPQDQEKTGRWRGVPVSPGLVRGPVRVAFTPERLDRVAPGDILVTHSTDPGWTPLFGRLGGLIMERGGQLSHGSVVAREYGLPAVVGIPHITAHLRDGDVVLLDGLTGTVTLCQ